MRNARTVPRQIPVPFIVKMYPAGGFLVAELKEDQAFADRYPVDQDVAGERDAHAVGGKVVGSDLLVQLETDVRNKMGRVADALCTAAGIIARF